MRGEIKVLTKQIFITGESGDTITINSEDVKYFVKNNVVKTVLRLTLYGYSDNIDDVQSTSYHNPLYDTTILLTPIVSARGSIYLLQKINERWFIFLSRAPKMMSRNNYFTL